MLLCLTGTPGIGKTTIIKKLVEYLKTQNVSTEGFFTEEIRDNQGNREGFDIVTINNQRGVLARKCGLKSPFKVGNYSVDVNQFEKLALPLFNELHPQVMIIDEVGKMELFSSKFKTAVENLVPCPDVTIVATVPLKSNDIFINNLKKKCKTLFHVTIGNRNDQLGEIVKQIVIK